MNTLAGFKLYGKNPNKANTMIMQKIPIAGASNTKLIIAYIAKPIIDRPVAKPSSPSVKFTAFENPTCQKMIKIT